MTKAPAAHDEKDCGSGPFERCGFFYDVVPWWHLISPLVVTFVVMPLPFVDGAVAYVAALPSRGGAAGGGRVRGAPGPNPAPRGARPAAPLLAPASVVLGRARGGTKPAPRGSPAAAPPPPPRRSTAAARECRFFSTAAGCRAGETCPFRHVAARARPPPPGRVSGKGACRFFASPAGCSRGDGCAFSHVAAAAG